MEIFNEVRSSAQKIRSVSLSLLIAYGLAIIIAAALVKPCSAAGWSRKIYLQLTVNDAEGNPVPKFEAMLHTYHEGYIQWQPGKDGKIHFGDDDTDSLYLRDDKNFQVIVRAPEMAPAFLHMEYKGPTKETMTLTPGHPVKLSVRTSDGRAIPKNVTPLVVYTDYAGRVRAGRMPENMRPGRVFDFEMSKVNRIDKGRYQFRVPVETPAFFLSIHEPGFMQLIETEVISEDELADGRIEWQLPEPAKLNIKFEYPDTGERPEYDFSLVRIASHIPDVGKHYTVWQEKYDNLSFDTILDDLPPKNYLLTMFLVPKKQQGVSDKENAARRYWDQQELKLDAGERKTINLIYAPYEPNLWRGESKAIVTVKKYGGEPAVGNSFSLSYIVPHYFKSIVVKQGNLDKKGQFHLEGVRPGPDGPEFFLRIRDKALGRIQMTEKGSEQFNFTLAPEIQDRVPDVTFRDVNTNESISMGTFKGRLVYLEFWATWCGPCKIPMIKLNEVVKRRRIDWDRRVHILAVSIDDSRDIVGPYIKKRGWNHVRHLWTGEADRTGFKSPAAEKFGIHGIPTAILIDPNGVIVWRGHPKDGNIETQIDELL
jgi:thiol-disulfide isomerase/thioredoxin